MSEEKRADQETLPDTPLHGHQEGRALDEGEEAEGGPVEQRSEGDQPVGGPTPVAGSQGADDQEPEDEEAGDDTPPPDESIGEEGLGTQSGASDSTTRAPRDPERSQ